MGPIPEMYPGDKRGAVSVGGSSVQNDVVDGPPLARPSHTGWTRYGGAGQRETLPLQP